MTSVPPFTDPVEGVIDVILGAAAQGSEIVKASSAAQPVILSRRNPRRVVGRVERVKRGEESLTENTAAKRSFVVLRPAGRGSGDSG